MTLTPQIEARAFRIWQFANSRGWDVTREEIRDRVDITENELHHTLAAKGWNGRLDRAARESGRYFSQRRVSGHVRQMQQGHDFDENLLDLTQIMGDNRA